MAELIIADPNLILLQNLPAQNTDSSFLLGEAVVQGEAVVLDETATPHAWVKGTANGSDVKAGKKDRGIVLTAGAVGQGCLVAKKGARISFNNALVQGRYYFLSGGATQGRLINDPDAPGGRRDVALARVRLRHLQRRVRDRARAARLAAG